MAIIFEKIRWKNLLSTGNAFNEIALDEHTSNLIVGENGAGKSTMIDALTFVLFGKPFRNITLGGLVNASNDKDCVVECEFTIGVNTFKVRRGLKPSFFEIYQNGKLIDQDSSAKDYQRMLEATILKMTYKTFTQIVVLGSASFKPFMQLKALDRREIVEDLLGIEIFSTMTKVLKQKAQTNREDSETNRRELVLVEDRYHNALAQRKDVTADKTTKESNLRKDIQYTQNQIDALQAEVTVLQAEVAALHESKVDMKVLTAKQNQLISLRAQISANKTKSENLIEFYQSNDYCPTCKQVLDGEFAENAQHQHSKEVDDYDDALVKLQKKMDVLNNELEYGLGIIDKIFTRKTNISIKETSIKGLQDSIKRMERDIDGLHTSSAFVGEIETRLTKLQGDIDDLTANKLELLEERKYLDLMASLLKDGGIKTRIIKQYLPVINSNLNQYLSALDFSVSFLMDENFDEEIKSRGRDKFVYHNFSEGEKVRIDLALLFTWRAVAKLKNSIDTNLLIMDEISDRSLDNVGIDSFLKLITNLSTSNTNIFVISPKGDLLTEKFTNTIRFTKQKQYSQIGIS